MSQFVEIVNLAKVRSNSNLVVSGLEANQNGWKKYSFYPNKGVVGQIMGEAQCAEGIIYLVQCHEHILVPVLPQGLSEISYEEFKRRLPNNLVVGKASDCQQNSNFNVDEAMDALGKMFGW